MRILQLFFFINLAFILNSCQEIKEPSSNNDSIVRDNEVTETEIKPAIPEYNALVITEDSIVAFYNNILGHLYPNRTLSTQYEDNAITVSPDALENIEGGGMSTKYLRVVDEIDFEVGTIIYETNTSLNPITLSIAILEEGNFLVSAMLLDINGQTVLRVSSNDSGNLDMGTSSYVYFTYDDLIHLGPIYTKEMTGDIRPNSLLSEQEKEELIKRIAFNKEGNYSTYSQEGMIEISKGEFISRDFDKMKYQPIIEELRGIEKHYVQNDLFKLNSLLQFNNDDRYQALENDLKAKYEEESFFKILLLDTRNGYIEFERLQTIVTEECKQSMVYWNKNDGGIVIAHEMNCCTMFCDGSISFQTYNKNSQSYVSIDSKEIVPQIDSLESLQPINYIDGDGFDTKYTLPENGKNIRYCAESNCLQLVWQDGIFSVEE